MVPELEKPQVTELHVRMDCNGCVNKIKRALHGIEGVYDIHIDFPQQKVTVEGRASPERIVKAIKKIRKIATICSHTEAVTADPPPPEAPPAEATPPPEQPTEAPPPENPAPEEEKPTVAAEETDATKAQPEGSSEAKDVGEIHMIHHYPHQQHHVYRDHWSDYNSNGYYAMRQEAPYHVVTHSYNSYRPAVSISGYGYLRSPPRDVGYRAPETYSDDYYQYRGSEGNNITSMFSDENPNACTIV